MQFTGVALPPGHSLGTPTNPEVWWRVQAHGTGIRGVTPLTDIAAAVARRGGTATSGSNGGNLVVGFARTLIRSEPRGCDITYR